MSLTALEITDVLCEIRSKVEGQRISRIYQRDASTLLIELRGEVLCLSVHPQASRIHLQREPQPREQVGSFAQLLRHRMQGRTVRALLQPDGDRMVRLELGAGPGERCLVAELTGTHGNLFWLEDELVVASLRPNRSRLRDNRPGRRYVPLLARMNAAAGRSRFQDAPSPSAAVASLYEARLSKAWRAEHIARLGRPLRRALRHERHLLARLHGDLERHESRLVRSRWGELILAQPHLVDDGATQVTVPDLFRDPEIDRVHIPLDPRRTAVANATRYLAEGARARRGVGRTTARIEQVEQRIARLETDLQHLHELDDEALAQLASQGSPSGEPGRPARARQARREPPGSRDSRLLRYRATGGQIIYVGRNAAANDHLTFRVARGRDVWLHARDVPGAHVVLWMDRSGAPDHGALLDAALLAKHHSDARSAPSCDVEWTYVKHLRRAHRPGVVYLAEQRTLYVRDDPDRLTELLTSARRDSEAAKLLADMACLDFAVPRAKGDLTREDPTEANLDPKSKENPTRGSS